MKNATAKLQTLEDIREAISVLATDLVRQNEAQQATAQLVQKMHGRIKLLTQLLDYLRLILERHGLVPPRPQGGSDVN